MLKEKYILLTKNLCLSQKKAVILHVGEGEDSPTQSLAYRDMETAKTENLYESRFVKAMLLLHKNWQQVLKDGCNTECTVEQAKAYYTASAVISKIDNEFMDLLIYGDAKDVAITFDEEGHLI